SAPPQYSDARTSRGSRLSKAPFRNSSAAIPAARPSNLTKLLRLGQKLARRDRAERRKAGGRDHHLLGLGIENAHDQRVVARQCQVRNPVVDGPLLAGGILAVDQYQFSRRAVLQREA